MVGFNARTDEIEYRIGP